MDPALLRVVVASHEFQKVDDLMTDVANGGSARLLAVWALQMRTNRRSRKDFTRLLFAHAIRKKPRWYTVFSNHLLCLWRLLRKMAAPHAQSHDVPMPISLSRRTRRFWAPTGLVHAAMPSLTANAQNKQPGFGKACRTTEWRSGMTTGPKRIMGWTRWNCLL